MGSSNYYADGQWNFICDICGRQNKSSDGVKTWDGFYVCRVHKEVRNPQDFVRGVREDLRVPWTRPVAPDQFVSTEYDRSFTDAISLPEAFAKGFSTTFGIFIYDAAAINGTAINAGALNFTATTQTNPEAAGVTEVFSIGPLKGFGDSLGAVELLAKQIVKGITESVAVTEFLSRSDGQATTDSLIAVTEYFSKTTGRLVGDSITIAETFLVQVSSQTALNGSAINQLKLG